MCGLAGFVSTGSAAPTDPRTTLVTLGKAIRHRGPDDGGIYWDETSSVGLSHRRLAIQDLSPLGAQPMVSSSGRFVIVFNGEIYNFNTLRRETQAAGYSFQGSSDTEVILAAFEIWGVEAALQRFAGMFAFAVLDREHQALWLARDRMGEKPLYYGWCGDTFLFGSELKALEAHPQFRATVNRDALTLLLRHNYIPAPHSIYNGIAKLAPGHYLWLNMGAGDITTTARPYWELSAVFAADPPESREAAVNLIEDRLRDVIKEQMVADVPLGAFLSGGIDSATITALMQQNSSQRVRTFSIGFKESGFNEAEHAAAVARHLGTEHTEMYVSPQDALELVPHLPRIADEPFGDSSLIPTFLVSQMTRDYVTVALSGDGGDELFAGYQRYYQALSGWQAINQQSITGSVTRRILNLPDSCAERLVRILKPNYRNLSRTAVRDKLSRERGLRTRRSLADYYRRRVGYWSDTAAVVRGGEEPSYALTQPLPESLAAGESMSQLQWLDLNSYLPDDILTKVDRASMANSLETRIPMLDPRFAPLALSLPPQWNAREGQGKAVLRDILFRHVPRELVDRPKQGFAVPIAQWLRGELREWAESLLSRDRLKDEGYLEPEAVRAIWSDHAAGRADYSFHLWGILMFQAWLDDRPGGTP